MFHEGTGLIPVISAKKGVRALLTPAPRPLTDLCTGEGQGIWLAAQMNCDLKHIAN